MLYVVHLILKCFSRNKQNSRSFKSSSPGINVNWLLPGTFIHSVQMKCTVKWFSSHKHQIKIKINQKTIWNQNQRSLLSSNFKSKSKDHYSDLNQMIQIIPNTDSKPVQYTRPFTVALFSITYFIVFTYWLAMIVDNGLHLMLGRVMQGWNCTLNIRRPGTRAPVQMAEGNPDTKIPESASTNQIYLLAYARMQLQQQQSSTTALSKKIFVLILMQMLTLSTREKHLGSFRYIYRPSCNRCFCDRLTASINIGMNRTEMGRNVISRAACQNDEIDLQCCHNIDW